MNGHDYIATVDLFGADGQCVARAGDRCGKVAEESLPWLLDAGLITLVKDSGGEESKTDGRDDVGRAKRRPARQEGSA